MWPAVTALAAELFRDGEIGHQAVTAALGLPSSDIETSPVLSMIKAGMWSPPKPVTA
ncbi:hypothetical protein [Nocardia sp. NPDC051463]|uniref:hypothetical protein n=1 Tax=Nocardia sp. NPDC051463 TaxID=3154845 RepID=UPI00344D071E